MKPSVQKEIFGIRKLKAGVCSVVLAVSFLGTQHVLAEEVVNAPVPAEKTETVLPPTTNQSTPQSENTTLVPEAITSSTAEKSVVESNASALKEQNNVSSISDENTSKIEAAESITTGAPAPAADVTALNVKDYGAVGDGVTADRDAIQGAIDAAAQGLGGGKVYFPEGTYLVDKILFLKSNTHLQLHDNATILNGINFKGRPSIVFMTGLFINGGEKVEWEPTENISVTGGTIDMNGALNEEGTHAKNLPLINSTGGFAIGNSSNFTIRNVTFKDSYQGHAIQIAGSKNVLIDNSRFIGQAIPKTMKDINMISKESIQIEPQTRKGFPYAKNETGKKSENVTIQNSYFGKSDKAGELVTAIGTHYQTLETENPSNIKILNNHFDNLIYSGVRFTGFTDILIKGNRFDKKSKEESVRYREEGGALLNAFSYKNTTDALDLNKHVVVTDNVFNIADPKTQAIRVARDSAEYLGKVTDITVTNNTITNTSQNSELANIQLTRISNNLNVSNNNITGGNKGIWIENSMGTITVKDNQLSDLSGDYVLMTDSGDNAKISIATHGAGNFNVTTEKEKYRFRAVNLSDKSYVATYADGARTSKVTNQTMFSVPMSQSEPLERYLDFKPNTSITVKGDLTKEYDGKAVQQDLLKLEIQGSTGEVSYTYYADKDLQKEISLPKTVGNYWVQVSVAGDEHFAPATVVLPFYIFVKAVPQTAPVTEELPEFQLSSYMPEKVDQRKSDVGLVEMEKEPVQTGKRELPKTGTQAWEGFAFSILGAGVLAGTVLKKRNDED